MLARRDQYGDRVPDDLVVLPDPDFLGSENGEEVMRATWYELDGYLLCASFKAIGGLCEDDPADGGVDIASCKIARVDDCLKRYDEVDGFYHA